MTAKIQYEDIDLYHYTSLASLFAILQNETIRLTDYRFLNDTQELIYAKLPKGFYIPTPVGHYSPDWAIVFHEGKVKHIYFVAETKGTMESLNLRPIEKSKIDCAKKFFAKLSDGLVTYDHVDSYQELMNKVLQ